MEFGPVRVLGTVRGGITAERPRWGPDPGPVLLTGPVHGQRAASLSGWHTGATGASRGPA